MYMSGHAVCDVCVSVSVLVRAYGNCTQMSSWWWLNLEIDPNNLTFWQVPSTTSCWYHQKFQVSLGTTPPPSNSHNQGLVPFLAGNPQLNLHLWLESWVFLLPGQPCQEMLCPKFPLTRKHLVDPWLKKFQELYCKRCSWATYFHQILQFCAWNCRWNFFLFNLKENEWRCSPTTDTKTFTKNLTGQFDFEGKTHWHTIFFGSIFGWTTDHLTNSNIDFDHSRRSWGGRLHFSSVPWFLLCGFSGDSCATEMAWKWHAWHNWHTCVHVHLGLPFLPCYAPGIKKTLHGSEVWYQFSIVTLFILKTEDFHTFEDGIQHVCIDTISGPLRKESSRKLGQRLDHAAKSSSQKLSTSIGTDEQLVLWDTLQGTNISHLGKGKSFSRIPWVGIC